MVSSVCCSDLDDYLATYVADMDVSAEGPFVELGLLMKALQCNGVSVFLDRRSEVPLTIMRTTWNEAETPTAEEPIAQIHM